MIRERAVAHSLGLMADAEDACRAMDSMAEDAWLEMDSMKGIANSKSSMIRNGFINDTQKNKKY